MNYDDMTRIILNLPFNTMTEIYNNGEQAILLYRPSTLSKRFKNYDINTNFQIFLKIGNEKPFRPNHLRLLIDLKLRSRELPKAKEELLCAFDKIFYGAEPLEAIKPLTYIRFTQYINPIDITAMLAQLFIIEQNIGYGAKSTFDPPALYLQGWIRTFIDSKQEIDQIIYRICRNTPPAIKYTCQDNKNHPKYNPKPITLWYIN
ncbi:MAG: hypothetical protein NC251_09510 [Lachnoclostridium sp.]|nr:hypothetical protein [Lachnospira sp.]MCM1248655.1 hypothetical protein [Lachnoclostridium sp.]